MKRIDRLFAILLLLQRKGQMRAQDLAVRFAVSERTIYRDVQSLSEGGVPVVSIPGQGYALLDTFRLPPVMLSTEEAQALFMGGWWLVCNAQGQIVKDVQGALEKIEAVLPTESKAIVHRMAQMIEFFPAQHKLDWETPHLLTLMKAISEQRVVLLRYQSYREYAVQQRYVEPHALSFASGAWYLNAYCRLRQDIRNFRLNRMHDLQVLDDVFKPRIVFPTTPEMIEVRLRFQADVWPFVQERQHYAFVDSDKNGIAIYHVEDLQEIQNWVLGFGTAVNVLAPDELRRWLLAEAESLIKLLT